MTGNRRSAIAEGHFTDQVVLVTGGSAGIGRQAALTFAAQGMRVVIAARGAERGEQVVREIVARGGAAEFVPTDISDATSVDALFGHIDDEYGRLDHAFNNAGTSGGGALVDLTEADFDRSFAVNTRGLWLCLRAELRRMSSGGRIVNNISVHGLRTVFPGIGAYVAAKHAAVALTRIAAVEHAHRGIRVNGIAPGPIDTEMLAESEQTVGGATAWKALIPAGRVGTTQEVAEVVLWLLSDAAEYVNGQVIAVDGGFLAS